MVGGATSSGRLSLDETSGAEVVTTGPSVETAVAARRGRRPGKRGKRVKTAAKRWATTRHRQSKSVPLVKAGDVSKSNREVRPFRGTKQHVNPGVLRAITLDVDGLREPGQCLEFFAFAARETPEVLLIAETHRTAAEACGLVAPNYTFLTETSRPRNKQRMRGGFVLLIRSEVTGGEPKDGTPQLSLPLHCRSILAFFGDKEQIAVKITGIYLPP